MVIQEILNLNLLFSAFFFCIIRSKSFPPTSSLSSRSLLGPSSSELSAVTLLASLATLLDTLLSTCLTEVSSSFSDSLRSSPRVLCGTFSSPLSTSESVSGLSDLEFTILFFFVVIAGETDLDIERDLEFTTLFFFVVITGDTDLDIERDLEGLLEFKDDLDLDLDLEREIEADLGLYKFS